MMVGRKVEADALRPAVGRGFLLCVLVSAGILLVTGAVRYGLPSPLHAAGRLFTLASENTVGAWWSGMLLAFLSLVAFDGYARARGRAPREAGAWATVAGLLLFLSLDEVGALHERMGGAGERLGIGEWGLVLPLGAVLGLLLARALLVFWSKGGADRRLAVRLAVGFGLLGSVAIQEYLQHKYFWPDGLISALRLVIEEGTELLGMLILMWAMRDNTAAFARRGAPPDLPTLAALDVWWRPLLAGGALAAPVLTLATVLLLSESSGRPSDWLAATFFAFTALALVRPALVRRERPDAPAWAAAALCLVASVAVLIVPPGTTRQVLGLEVGLRLALLGPIGLLFAAAGAAAAARRAGPAAHFAAIAVLAATLPLLHVAAWSTLLWSQVLALFAFGLVAHAGRRLAPAGSGLRPASPELARRRPQPG